MVARAIAFLAGFSLAVSPAIAQPSAQALSLGNAPTARAAAPTDDESDLAGGGLIPMLAVVAIIAGGVLLVTGVFGDDDNDNPTSP